MVRYKPQTSVRVLYAWLDISIVWQGVLTGAVIMAMWLKYPSVQSRCGRTRKYG